MTVMLDVDARVLRALSPSETMNREDDTFPKEYWAAGRSALQAVAAALDAAKKPASEIRHILDLPCGHGRVLRYLHAAFPDAQLAACDLLRDGVDFCANTFGAAPIYSQEKISTIPLPVDTYDLIWVGSLLTHVDAPQWQALFEKMHGAMREGGVLVFTTHGRRAYRRLKGLEDEKDYGIPYWRVTSALFSYERSGFGYADYLGTPGYGISVSSASWVMATLAKQQGLSCVSFVENGWHTVQDVFACVKESGSASVDRRTSVVKYMKHVVREVWRPSE